MPIYEYQCRREHITELILPVGQALEYITCHKKVILKAEGGNNFSIDCGAKAERIWSLPATVQIGKPTHYFRNPRTGEIRTLVQDKDKFNPPKGFVVEEARGQFERLKLEKTLSQNQQAENEIVTEQRRQMKSATMKNRHDDVRANLGKYDHGTQELLKASMERSKKKEIRAKKNEVVMTVNHTNKNNMEVG